MGLKVRYVAAGMLLGAQAVLGQLDRAGPPTTANSLALNAAKVQAGAAQFRQFCTGCHGRGGEGGQGEGQGPNLATNWEVRRSKDPELFGFIRNGVKGTSMPAFALPDDQIWQLAAFVRSLNAPAISLPVEGDVDAGKALFFGTGECAACHMIRGRGGYLGPDLSDIGALRRLGELRESLSNPNMEASSIYQPVVLTDAQGRQIRAVAKHISPWSAQVLDAHGDLHMMQGSELKRLSLQKTSWMAVALATKHLAPEDIKNLTAFLSRQAVNASSSATSKEPVN